MVRHVNQIESTELAAQIEAELLDANAVTVRILFIKVLNWLRVRGVTTRQQPLPLPNYPWAEELRRLIDVCPSFSESFQVRDDHVEFKSSLCDDDIRWVEAYVVKNYVPVARR